MSQHYSGYSEQWLKDYQNVATKHGRVSGGDVRSHTKAVRQFDPRKQHLTSSPVSSEKQGLRDGVGSNPAHSPYKSKLEAAWANKLELEKRICLIDNYYYEPFNIRLPGTKNFYKPDFLVQVYVECGIKLTFYEVKGHNRSDDRSLVKMKTAAGLNPWATFILVKHVKGNWDERQVT